MKEHYRLGSTQVIVGRSFCDTKKITDLNEIRSIFNTGIGEIRALEAEAQKAVDYFKVNHEQVEEKVNMIVNKIKIRTNIRYENRQKIITNLREEYGDAFYLLDSEQFQKNFIELRDTFRSIYPNFNIAYSYKTNYTPKFCKLVDKMGGYAEVVSEMEMEIALRCGVKHNRIIWNGPIKNSQKLEEFLVAGGIDNVDCIEELDIIKGIAKRHPSNTINLGIRCNYEVGDGVVSRFGF